MKNLSTKNINRNPKGKSALGIAFASLLSAGTLASAGVCFWQISKNTTESSDFANSINARIKIDAVAFEKDKSPENAEKNIKKAAETISAWMKSCGQENYDVSHEFYKNDDDTFSTYLNARFTVDKIKDKSPTSKEEEDKKIDNDPYLSTFSKNGFNTNNRSLVYRWYVPQTAEIGTQPLFSVVNLEEIVTLPKDLKKQDNPTKIISDKDGKWGVMYHIQDNKLLNAIYADMVTAYKYTQETSNGSNAKTLDNWRQPRLYIINNLEGLVNEANYHLINYCYNGLGKSGGDISWYQKRYKGTEYETFAKAYLAKDDKGREQAHANLTSLDTAQVSFSKDQITSDPSGFERTANFDILRSIDSNKPGTLDHAGFMSKYVEKIFTIDSKNWQQAFPAKITDEYKNEVDEACAGGETVNKITYMWYGQTSKDLATDYLSKLITYKTPCKIQNIEITASLEPKDKLSKFQESYSTISVKPKFIETIFGGLSVTGWLSIGFLAFLIALLIILACLYRMTGVFSWICLMFTISLSQLLATLSVTVLSMSTLLGLFAVAIIGFVSALFICGRIKRRINCNEDTQVAIGKGFRKSLFPVLDLSIVSIIFGICITYIAPIALNAFGILLIIGGFANFFINYLLNGGINLLVFKNNITFNNYKLLGKPSNKANEALRETNPLVPKNMDASKLDFDYYTSAGTKKVNLFTKGTWIALIVLAVVFIVGFVVLGLFGFANSSMFHSSTCVAIYYENSDLLTQPWFVNAGLKYSYYRNYDNWWFFYTSENVTNAVESLVASGHVQINVNLLVQSIIGTTNGDILNKTIIAISIASAVLCVYSIIRFNIASFVPMLLGSFVVPMLILAVATICQVKFDQTVVISYALVCIINDCVLFNTLSTIQGAWSRRNAYTREQLRFIINSSFKLNWTFLWSFGLALLILIICFTLTSPMIPKNVTMISTVALMFIGSAISLCVTPFAVSYLEYFFLGFRNNILAKMAKKKEGKIVVNYDQIDEQLIEGVNKFTKNKQIPIYESWRKKKENEQNTTKNI